MLHRVYINACLLTFSYLKCKRLEREHRLCYVPHTDCGKQERNADLLESDSRVRCALQGVSSTSREYCCPPPSSGVSADRGGAAHILRVRVQRDCAADTLSCLLCVSHTSLVRPLFTRHNCRFHPSEQLWDRRCSQG